MVKKIIGQFGVDSGTIMIIDPCYLNDPLRWKPENLDKIAQEHKDKGETRWAENATRLATEKRQLQNIIGDWKAVCKDLENVPMNYASGVITRTNRGDGGYDVIGTFNKAGIMTKIEINL